jgi:cytosine/uracil/thiamine/allantoin permease
VEGLPERTAQDADDSEETDRRCKCVYVGICVINARDGFILVCSLTTQSIRNGLRLMQTALLAIALGNIIMGIVMVLNATTGARLHIAFPILNRSHLDSG